LFFFLVGCNKEEPRIEEPRIEEPKYDGIEESVKADGLYLKLKSGGFIKLYSLNTSPDVVSISSYGRLSVSKGVSWRYGYATGNSLDDVFQAVEKEDFDSFILKGKGEDDLSIHRATLMITPSDTVKDYIRNKNEYQILNGKGRVVETDIKKIDDKHLYGSIFIYHFGSDDFGAFFEKERTFHINKRETRDGYQIKTKNPSKGFFAVTIGDKYYWVYLS
jgi:hypothetical protein